jgi:hypothetical protein
MINQLKQTLWNQFGASIDMLHNAVELCPEELMHSNKRIFYTIYHTIFFLDYYSTIPPRNVSPLLPYTLKAEHEIPEEALDDIVPDRLYSKAELIQYLLACRERCRKMIDGLTEESLQARFVEEPDWGPKDYPVLEIFLYNMRHVQHHAAQLNLYLRQHLNTAPGWVRRAADHYTP